MQADVESHRNGRDGGAERHTGGDVAGVMHPSSIRDRAIGGTSTAAPSPMGRPAALLIRMAAAVVEVACADGKLNWLGVPTFTATAG
ncbi:hypothetical protein NIIDMKKI_78240 [Mycobacterium kansasii]|uniref:Uncharacterized protein n=1 Tax=Mycobacterium kansasii TaxID=1768 RepID=A0A7G1IUX4_MYCKA|nr:hypothetical protein NIIDMKKI_78240 [Mycobacterium kansasii]